MSNQKERSPTNWKAISLFLFLAAMIFAAMAFIFSEKAADKERDLLRETLRADSVCIGLEAERLKVKVMDAIISENDPLMARLIDLWGKGVYMENVEITEDDSSITIRGRNERQE